MCCPAREGQLLEEKSRDYNRVIRARGDSPRREIVALLFSVFRFSFISGPLLPRSIKEKRERERETATPAVASRRESRRYSTLVSVCYTLSSGDCITR